MNGEVIGQGLGEFFPDLTANRPAVKTHFCTGYWVLIHRRNSAPGPACAPFPPPEGPRPHLTFRDPARKRTLPPRLP